VWTAHKEQAELGNLGPPPTKEDQVRGQDQLQKVLAGQLPAILDHLVRLLNNQMVGFPAAGAAPGRQANGKEN
jgi:hypothetical protein